eukprot:TRINITY_DN8051_c0_g1_i1.p1 TRINITY_DN8051_c0_g1~~TRINITY_DN8051_c0_g1_i1.p1  ORF type:complete len:500 (-),score=114.91 TRINITY_DN8051_c0_g1_i1:8-1507(-)
MKKQSLLVFLFFTLALSDVCVIEPTCVTNENGCDWTSERTWIGCPGPSADSIVVVNFTNYRAYSVYWDATGSLLISLTNFTFGNGGIPFGPTVRWNAGTVRISSSSRNRNDSTLSLMANLESNGTLTNEGLMLWGGVSRLSMKTMHDLNSIFTIFTQGQSYLTETVTSYGTINIQEQATFTIPSNVSIDTFGAFVLNGKAIIVGDGFIHQNGFANITCVDMCFVNNINSKGKMYLSPNSLFTIKNNWFISSNIVIGSSSKVYLWTQTKQDCSSNSLIELQSNAFLLMNSGQHQFCNLKLASNAYVLVYQSNAVFDEISSDPTAIIESQQEITIGSFSGILKIQGNLKIRENVNIGRLELSNNSLIQMNPITITTRELILAKNVWVEIQLGSEDQLPFKVFDTVSFQGDFKDVKFSIPNWKGCNLSMSIDDRSLMLMCTNDLKPGKPSIAGKIVLILAIIGVSFAAGILVIVAFRRHMKKANKDDSEAKESLIKMSTVRR